MMWLCSVAAIILPQVASAGEVQTFGDVANNLTLSFASITRLITSGCYLIGLAFAVTGILQFKQHKDNPTQITIGKPISHVFIAASLVFMPSILEVAGYTMFGPSGGTVAGAGGIEFGASHV